MKTLFFYGSLRHLPLLEQVLGRTVAGSTSEAILPGHAVRSVVGEIFPMIVKAAGEEAQGLLVRGLSEDDIARLDFYEDDFVTRPCNVESAAGPEVAGVYFPTKTEWIAGPPWSLAEWVETRADLAMAATEEAMAAYGRLSVEWVDARYPQILSRAQARVNAQTTAPTTLRHRAAPGDVEVNFVDPLYDRFFLAREFRASHRLFAGGRTPEVRREVFIMADAVTVLPFDPVRDRVLLVEQMRFGPLARGDEHPWILECIAGRIDGGESPEEAARREALEEGRIALKELISIGGTYPSPGAVSEYLHGFLALADLIDDLVSLGGLETEQEDIRIHVLAFDEAMALLDTGEIESLPLQLSLLQLARRRETLRAG